MDYLAVGKRIREARRRAGLSQTELAAKSGYNAEHISRIENAHTKMSLDAMVSIANALTLSVDLLLRDVVYESKVVVLDQLHESLKDCNSAELSIITDVVLALKSGLRNQTMQQEREV